MLIKRKGNLRLISLVIIGVLFLSACSLTDLKGPSASVSNIELNQGQVLTEKRLIDLLVNYYYDDQSALDEITVDVLNFEDLNTDEVGNYNLQLALEDASGNRTIKNVTVTVVSSPKENLATTKSKLRSRLVELNKYELITQEELQTQLELVNNLSADELDAYQVKLNKLIKEKSDLIAKDNQMRIQEIHQIINQLADTGASERSFEVRLSNLENQDINNFKQLVAVNLGLRQLKYDAMGRLEAIDASVNNSDY